MRLSGNGNLAFIDVPISEQKRLAPEAFDWTHNWVDPLTESLEFETSIHTSSAGLGYRSATTFQPFRKITLKLTEFGDSAAQLVSFLRKYQGRRFIFLPEQRRRSGIISGWRRAEDPNRLGYYYTLGQYMKPDFGCSVCSYAGEGNAHRVDPRFYDLKERHGYYRAEVGVISEPVRFQWHSSQVLSAEIPVNVCGGGYTLPPKVIPAADGLPILTGLHNWREGLDESAEALVDSFKFTGCQPLYARRFHSPNASSFDLLLTFRETGELDEFKRFFEACLGAAGAFWFVRPLPEGEIVGNWEYLKTTNGNLVWDSGGTDRKRRRLILRRIGGKVFAKRLTGLVRRLGTDTYSMTTEPLSGAQEPSGEFLANMAENAAYMGLRCRFSADKLEIKRLTSDVSEVSVRIQTEEEGE